MNLLMMSDLYKYGHFNMYPDGTTKVYSYFCSRNSRDSNISKVAFFGLQYYLKEFLMKPLTENDKVEFIKYVEASLGKEAVSPKILNDIDRMIEWGYLPLQICALPEGSLVPFQVPMFTIENTHPDYYWLTNFVETLLCKVWMPCTSATTALQLRKLSEKYAELTCDDMNHVPFQFHDFSFRGLSSNESGQISGASHALLFDGTDTMGALPFLDRYYNEFTGFSVPATEHSISSAYGADNEFEYFETLIDKYPKGILSLISDTYDLWRVFADFLPRLKSKIMARDGKIVLRPDSGDPLKIICGDPDADPNSPDYLGCLKLLWGTFGGTYNKKGYRVLDSHVGLIYGDGIYLDRADKIFARMRELGFASSNVVFGAGAYGYQYVSRDTHGFALKASYVMVNDEDRDIYKSPKTDSSKRSARGLLAVHKDSNGEFILLDQCSRDEVCHKDNLMKVVFRNGVLYNEQNFFEIRERLHNAV